MRAELGLGVARSPDMSPTVAAVAVVVPVAPTPWVCKCIKQSYCGMPPYVIQLHRDAKLHDSPAR